MFLYVIYWVKNSDSMQSKCYKQKVFNNECEKSTNS